MKASDLQPPALEPAPETFGFTHGQDRLIAKLRTMDPDMRAEILHPPTELERTGTP